MEQIAREEDSDSNENDISETENDKLQLVPVKNRQLVQLWHEQKTGFTFTAIASRKAKILINALLFVIAFSNTKRYAFPLLE